MSMLHMSLDQSKTLCADRAVAAHTRLTSSQMQCNWVKPNRNKDINITCFLENALFLIWMQNPSIIINVRYQKEIWANGWWFSLKEAKTIEYECSGIDMHRKNRILCFFFARDAEAGKKKYKQKGHACEDQANDVCICVSAKNTWNIRIRAFA